MVIYEIKMGDYFYVGSSKNGKRRKLQHLWKLKRSEHFNKFMQNVYDTHDDFNFTILKECETIEDMKCSEESTIEKYKCLYGDKCMNLTTKYGGGSEWRNHKTEEELKIIDYNRTHLSPEKQIIRNQNHSQTIQNIPYADRKDWYLRAADSRAKNIKDRKNYSPIKFEIILPDGNVSIENYDTETEFFNNTCLEETSLRELKNSGEKIIKRRLCWTRHRFPVGTVLRIIS